MKTLAFGLASVGIALIAACSSSSTSAPVSADQACSDYAAAICNRASTCSTVLVQVNWGDVASCAASFKTLCLNALAAPSTSITPNRTETCSKAITSATCDDVFDRNPPPDCRPTAGTIANGVACGDDSQCASTYCNRGANASCGTCSPVRAKVGEACTGDDSCDFQLKCASNVCVALGASGAACDVKRPCASSLVCSIPMGAMAGTCAAPAADGQPCTSGIGLGTCDIKTGDYCNPKTKVCEKLAVSTGTGACGYDMATGKVTVCASNGTCAALGVGMTGNCQAAAAAGATCNPTMGPACVVGATCVNNVCKLSDPASCR